VNNIQITKHSITLRPKKARKSKATMNTRAAANSELLIMLTFEEIWIEPEPRALERARAAADHDAIERWQEEAADRTENR
jgi:hypothetical protein